MFAFLVNSVRFQILGSYTLFTFLLSNWRHINDNCFQSRSKKPWYDKSSQAWRENHNANLANKYEVQKGEKKKITSFEPDSNQRPMDYFSTTVHRSTNWAIEGCPLLPPSTTSIYQAYVSWSVNIKRTLSSIEGIVLEKIWTQYTVVFADCCRPFP